MEHTFNINNIDRDSFGKYTCYFDGTDKNGTSIQGFFEIIPDDQKIQRTIIINIADNPVIMAVGDIQQTGEKQLQMVVGGEIFVLNFTTADLLRRWPIDLLRASGAATITQIERNTAKLRIRL